LDKERKKQLTKEEKLVRLHVIGKWYLQANFATFFLSVQPRKLKRNAKRSKNPSCLPLWMDEKNKSVTSVLNRLAYSEDVGIIRKQVD
jgi:hypothetical protein